MRSKTIVVNGHKLRLVSEDGKTWSGLVGDLRRYQGRVRDVLTTRLKPWEAEVTARVGEEDPGEWHTECHGSE